MLRFSRPLKDILVDIYAIGHFGVLGILQFSKKRVFVFCFIYCHAAYQGNTDLNQSKNLESEPIDVF